MCTSMSDEIIISNMKYLTKYEQNEIRRYIGGGIYYMGRLSSNLNRKKRRNYNDERGFYEMRPGDHILYRFQILKILGRGSYGEVCSALDHKTMSKVAIKINRLGSKREKETAGEIIVYEYLNLFYSNGLNELSHMLYHFRFRGHTCIVMQLYKRDLFYEMKKRNFKRFKVEEIKDIVLSVVKGLLVLHNVNLVHGDLKCDNVSFFKRNSLDTTIIDLGNCKFYNEFYKGSGHALYYRAPELILHLRYGPEIDMWALACITYELATGKSLFRGECTNDQLIRMMEVLGVPPEEMIHSSARLQTYFYENGMPKYCSSKHRDEVRLLEIGKSPSGCERQLPGRKCPFTRLVSRSTAFVDFLQQCLIWNPAKRMTAQDALSHKWLLQRRLPKINTVSDSTPTIVGVSKSLHSTLKQHSQEFVTKISNVLPSRVYSCTTPPSKCSSLITIRNPSFNSYDMWTVVRAKYLTKLYKRD